MSGYVYFIECTDYIKIGFTIDVEKRFKTLQHSNPLDLKLLCSFRGTMAKEAELLHKWRHLRHRGEWFRRAPDLAAWLEKRMKIGGRLP
jgi:predicted GIY-YIG superfamily endonuclease